jgi:hypothetical protein
MPDLLLQVFYFIPLMLYLLIHIKDPTVIYRVRQKERTDFGGA